MPLQHLNIGRYLAKTLILQDSTPHFDTGIFCVLSCQMKKFFFQFCQISSQPVSFWKASSEFCKYLCANNCQHLQEMDLWLRERVGENVTDAWMKYTNSLLQRRCLPFMHKSLSGFVKFYYWRPHFPDCPLPIFVFPLSTRTATWASWCIYAHTKVLLCSWEGTTKRLQGISETCWPIKSYFSHVTPRSCSSH